MKKTDSGSGRKSLGIIGFGAFGQLVAQHLQEHFELFAYDRSSIPAANAKCSNVRFISLKGAARCDVVLIASPVSSFESVVSSVATACRPGALVVDVGSVKVKPSEIMRRLLPEHVNIVATHPLFGPQSAKNGIRGLKIALCPIRGNQHWATAAFLRKSLGLDVIFTTPMDHDKDAAIVQGLTHLIAKVLLNMKPLPSRMTTKSFDLLVESILMVQNDAPEVFEAIENDNPYAEEIRERFFELAAELKTQLTNPGRASNCDKRPKTTV